jgi:hypothetical protein
MPGIVMRPAPPSSVWDLYDIISSMRSRLTQGSTRVPLPGRRRTPEPSARIKVHCRARSASFLCAIFVLACVALIPACAVQTHAVRPEGGLSVDRVLHVAANGDWLVIRGLHRSDDAVATLTNMPLSHVGVLDLERREVIEAEGVGVHASPLDEFVGKAERLLVVRPVWASETSTRSAIERARGLVGSNYDYLGLIGLNVPDRYYCTELALSVYQPAGSKPPNPFPPVVAPGQLYHWGTILYDSGPVQR